MMKVGIIGAMPQEIAILRDALIDCKTKNKAKCTLFSGHIHGIEVVLLQSGIGKVAASIATSLLIEYFKPDIIINTGSAGGVDNSLNLGDVVISSEVRHHDVDFTAFGFEIGQMANQPAAFIADEKLIKLTEQALTALSSNTHNKIKAVRGLICTGDAFICSADKQQQIRENFPNVVAVDMEAAAVAQTCHQFEVPFVVVRAISDVANKESRISFEEFLPLAAESSSKMVLQMIALLK